MDPMPAIFGAVGAEFDVTEAELLRSSRARGVVLARQTAMYLALRLTTMTYPEIGRAFNGRDHTTVMYACSKVEARLSEEALYRRRRVDTVRRFREFMTRLM